MGTLTVSYNGSSIIDRVSQSSLPNISYNGVNIVTALKGSKTLNCANKLMRTNIKVGTKTLNCANKLMRTNIVVTYTAADRVTHEAATNSTSHHVHASQATLGNNLLIAGGIYNEDGIVDVYNSSLTHSIASPIRSRAGAGATVSGTEYAGFASNGKYAIHYGGRHGNQYVDAYNSSLTRIDCANSYAVKYKMACGKVGNYAAFIGGVVSITGSGYLEAYDESLTKTNKQILHKDRSSGGSIGNYIYADSENGAHSYNSSLTESNAVQLRERRDAGAVARVGNYLVFAGGVEGELEDTYSFTVETINTSLTRGIATSLTQGVENNLGASCGDQYAIFAGGTKGTNGGSDFMRIAVSYNTALTRAALSNTLQEFCSEGIGGSVGDYAIFSLGRAYNQDSRSVSYSTKVDAYKLEYY